MVSRPYPVFRVTTGEFRGVGRSRGQGESTPLSQMGLSGHRSFTPGELPCSKGTPDPGFGEGDGGTLQTSTRGSVSGTPTRGPCTSTHRSRRVDLFTENIVSKSWRLKIRKDRSQKILCVRCYDSCILLHVEDAGWHFELLQFYVRTKTRCFPTKVPL